MICLEYMDLYFSNLIQEFRAPALDAAMLFFTYLGNWEVVLILITIAGIFFAAKKHKDYILAILFSVGGGEVLVWVIKHIVQRPRPFLTDDLVFEKSFSFPSGHAFAAVAFYGLLAYFLISAVKSRFWKIFFIAVCALLALTIGISRIYLGVHWPTDVLAGFALGIAWLAIIITVLKKIKK